ncbi:hypothetical protein [Lutibaculum baratangense]|uniref:Uncharacterized protein n=1 Tax=Lutibaculum baratangense AMV1 TaxID=631454 RepID=V4RHG3_9HYPH|nr:hypothetical protein [Lutibaculum baratangense]ESR22715.1 hypothetical protein N177_3852 [Lutibaculum baratangense AMV1]
MRETARRAVLAGLATDLSLPPVTVQARDVAKDSAVTAVAEVAAVGRGRDARSPAGDIGALCVGVPGSVRFRIAAV